jgi:serine/threonine protein kinase
MNNSMKAPSQIGRFKILGELGEGPLGVVYLASDPQRESRVAIRVLQSRADSGGNRMDALEEIRTISKLQHPHIVPLHEVGEYEKRPYLVFGYVEGSTLRDLMQKEAPLSSLRAGRLMHRIAEGMADAHEKGVVHRALRPSSILIGQEDHPHIMDFGVSLLNNGASESEACHAGTPCYLSPEQVTGKTIGPQTDIFALGLIFYEMLVGESAIAAENLFAASHKISHESIQRPSSKNPDVDAELDAVVSRAVMKEPQERYADVSEMKTALDAYLAADHGSTANPQTESHSTLEFLLRRIRHKSDFPSFSRNIMEINKRASNSGTNYSSALGLAKVILKDYSLTSKLLKLVNSAFYGQFARTVTTISRAVVVLGFEQVRLAATSLILFEHLRNKSQALELKDAAISSFMSGIIAKDLAAKADVKEVEELFICSMLHNLGQHLALFYFPEEYGRITNLTAQKGLEEDAASRAVLGISYEDLGIGVAKTWEFPDKIVQSMRSLPKGKIKRAKSAAEKLQSLAGFSNELCAIIATKGGKERDSALAALLSRYESTVPVSESQISRLLQGAWEKVEGYSDILGIDPKKSPFLRQVATHAKAQKDTALPEDKDAKPAVQKEEVTPERCPEIVIEEHIADTEEGKDAESILISGIQEVTNTLLEDYALNDVLTMLLETMYRGFGFQRVILCFRDKNNMRMGARLGFGNDIDRIIERFSFKIEDTSDVFNLALQKMKDLSIEDANDERIRRGIPEWFAEIISSPAFVLYPINVGKIPLGLIYADRETKGPVITGNQLKLMKTLCNQAILAIKQMKQSA